MLANDIVSFEQPGPVFDQKSLNCRQGVLRIIQKQFKFLNENIWGHMVCFTEKYGKLSLNNLRYPFLSGALLSTNHNAALA